jgi:3-deoxy-D-manno-octulosonic acid kinase
MADITTTRAGRDIIWHDAALLPQIEPGLFDPDWLNRTGRLTGTSTGRNTAWFLHHQGQDMVLRHYWRGGMVGRVIKDRYWREPVENTRAMREFTLLDWMHGQGLPVPRPIAARVRPGLLSYRADLLMARIPDTRPLADILTKTALPATDWGRIGAVIARMHALGVDHSDLNCRNILLDGAGDIWLIDFDKCARRQPGAWAQANLDRLERSLRKEKTKQPHLHWNDPDFAALRDGYHTTAGQTGATP